MIYDKPRDINLRVFPSFYTLAQERKKRRKVVKAEAKPEIKAQKKVIANEKQSIIDINDMPIIDGIPMLKFQDKPVEKTTPKTATTEIEGNTDFDVSTFPDIDGIPLLILPDKPEIKVVTPPSPPPAKETVKKQRTKTLPKKKEKTKAKGKIENKKQIIKAATFFLMLYIGASLAFALPLRPTYSETEKRELEKFPKFSAADFISGDYFDDIGTWFSDTFPFREELTKAGTHIKSFYGFDSIVIHGDVDTGDEIPDMPQEIEPIETEPETTVPPVTVEPSTEASKPDIKTESLGAIIVAGDSAYEYYAFSESLAPRFINSVNNIKSTADIKGEVYSMIVPTSIDITLHDALRADVKSADQKKALDYFNASLKNTTAVTGIYEAERLHRNEYTYFRTDHHWTALGAYYAYEQFAKTKGVTPVPLTEYKTTTYGGFLGSFYSQSGQNPNLSRTPDFVTAYLPFNDTVCTIKEKDGDEFQWDIIGDVSTHSANLKYLTFIGGDNALTTITNNDNPNGETCVVIKESYGNAFVPFLVPHYSTIYVIDPRHYNGTLSDFTAEKEIDDIIFISNISTTRNSVYIKAMEEFIR